AIRGDVCGAGAKLVPIAVREIERDGCALAIGIDERDTCINRAANFCIYAAVLYRQSSGDTELVNQNDVVRAYSDNGYAERRCVSRSRLYRCVADCNTAGRTIRVQRQSSPIGNGKVNVVCGCLSSEGSGSPKDYKCKDRTRACDMGLLPTRNPQLHLF